MTVEIDNSIEPMQESKRQPFNGNKACNDASTLPYLRLKGKENFFDGYIDTLRNLKKNMQSVREELKLSLSFTLFCNYIIGEYFAEHTVFLTQNNPNIFGNESCIAARRIESSLLIDPRMIRHTALWVKKFGFMLSSTKYLSHLISSCESAVPAECPKTAVRSLLNDYQHLIAGERKHLPICSILRKILVCITIYYTGNQQSILLLPSQYMVTDEGAAIASCLVAFSSSLPDKALDKCVEVKDDYLFVCIVQSLHMYRDVEPRYRRACERVLGQLSSQLSSSTQLQNALIILDSKSDYIIDVPQKLLFSLLLNFPQSQENMELFVRFLVMHASPSLLAFLIVQAANNRLGNIELNQIMMLLEYSLSTAALKFHQIRFKKSSFKRESTIMESLLLLRESSLDFLLSDLSEPEDYDLRKAELIDDNYDNLGECWTTIREKYSSFFWLGLIMKRCEEADSSHGQEGSNKRMRLEDGVCNVKSIFTSSFLMKNVSKLRAMGDENPLIKVCGKHPSKPTPLQLVKFSSDFIGVVSALPFPTIAPFVCELTCAVFPSSNEDFQYFSQVLLNWLAVTADKSISDVPSPEFAVAFESAFGHSLEECAKQNKIRVFGSKKLFYPLQSLLGYFQNYGKYSDHKRVNSPEDAMFVISQYKWINPQEVKFGFNPHEYLIYSTLQYIVVKLRTEMPNHPGKEADLSSWHCYGQLIREIMEIAIKCTNSTVYSVVYFFEWLLRQPQMHHWSPYSLLHSICLGLNHQNNFFLMFRYKILLSNAYCRLLCAYTPVVLTSERILCDNDRIWWIYTQYFCSYAIVDAYCKKFKETNDKQKLAGDPSQQAVVRQLLSEGNFDAVKTVVRTIVSYVRGQVSASFSASPWMVYKKVIAQNLKNEEYSCRWFYVAWLVPVIEASHTTFGAKVAAFLGSEEMRGKLFIKRHMSFIKSEIAKMPNDVGKEFLNHFKY